jgi:hypothetical protein
LTASSSTAARLPADTKSGEQPRRRADWTQEHIMSAHKFQVGQIVQYTPTLRFSGAAGGIYKVARRMPEEDGEFTYRILGRGEMQERNARESELCELDEAP